MSDMREFHNAVSALSQAGFIPCDDDQVNWERPGTTDGATLLDDGTARISITVPHSKVAGVVFPLTLDEVNKACEEAFRAVNNPAILAPIRAYWLDVMERLRNQINPKGAGTND